MPKGRTAIWGKMPVLHRVTVTTHIGVSELCEKKCVITINIRSQISVSYYFRNPFDLWSIEDPKHSKKGWPYHSSWDKTRFEL